MVNPVDLAKYTESDEDEDQVLIKKSSKRSEWAKGKSRAQPSENWDDDFLFGSASTSTDSLSISSPLTKPPSSKSTTNERSIKSHPPLPPDVHPTAVVRYQDSNASTPRKKSQSSNASVTPSLQSPSLLTSPSRPNNPHTSTNTTPKALSVRPPSSAPASRAGLTHPTPLVLSSAIQPLRHGSDPDSGSQTRQSQRKPTLAGRTAQHSRPPLSLRRRPSSHQAVSSQDSVPSISDLSSAGIRSPSSSLSTTDERSRSSDDYSAGFGRNSGRCNRSFNTETEFTEPETELDWGEDTDLDNRSSCSPVNLAEQQRSERLSLAGSHPRPPALKLKGSVRSVRAVDSSRSSRALLASRSSRSSLASPSDSSLTTKFMTTGPSPLLEPSNASYQRSAHSSFDSQTTFTSVQSSKSKTATVDQHVLTGSSSKSSIAYKSNHSDISLNSTSSRLMFENEVQIPTLSANYETQSHRRSQNRNPSMSSSSSSRAPPLAYHASSSDFDALTSGTETDGSGHPRSGPLPSRNSSQRSRKQALYSRPSYASPGTPVLTISSSSSTLNTSSRSPSGRVTDEGEADISPCKQIVEEDGRLKNLRRRLRKKRPSALPLSPVPVSSSSTTVLRKPSVAESIYSDTQLSGDLAFAADSEDEGRGQTRRSTRNATVAKPPSSPFEMIEKSDLLSINLRSPTPVASGSGLNIRARSSVSSYGSSQPSQMSATKVATKAGSTESKKPKTRRPLSFTALLSRNSVGSLSPAQTSKAAGIIKPAEPSPSPVSGLFIRKSTETVREPLETLATTGAAPTAPLTSYARGHLRQAASIGSNPEPSGESFFSRVRRLSSRKSTPPGTPNRKRFSIIHGSSSSRLSTSPSSSTNALSASVSSTPSAHRRTNRSPTLVQTGPGGTGTVKGRRPSTRESSDRPTGLLNRRTSLRRRFSVNSNNKAAADQPNLTTSPPAAPHLISNHNNTSQRSLGEPSSSSAASFASTRRSIANSKPPKSNPGLRRKAAASVSATLEAYSLNSPPPPSEVDVPTSEPLPDPSTTTIPAPPVVIGRSNSMGELRIPSRITSQQGRLQNELNQMKEFARGIDDLKSMRSHYRSLIESTAAATTSKINIKGNKEGDEDEFEKEEKDHSDGESVQPSPTALARLSETIAKIEANYREWWTCCNVLIDLGDGERDPRTRFTPERVRAFSCDPNNKSSTASTFTNTTNPIDQQNKHFEILKTMFGPGASPPRVADEDQTITIPDDGSVKGKSTTLTNLNERSPGTIRRRPKPRLRRTFAGYGTIGSERDEISETDRSSSCRSVGNSAQVRSMMKVRGRVQGQGRTALQGVKDFLRTLKARMQDEKPMIGSAPELSTAITSVIATSAIGIRSVSSPSYVDRSNSNSTSTTTSESEESEECWDELFANRTESLDLASTSTNAGGVNGNINGQKKRLALSSDRMPLLLNYLTIVRIQCEACLKELRSQTV
ncbi:hypothetical protein CROQUDRAFT_651626 [Cronartium quercuum f. sp. fusiforme G11]|uniref:Uncharacterized protein n=1 Tax=Cronartium quercuum f. sp. fusiforme G11 TaxID=708437 RepID=A0A9P6NX77_9BASI|nr:hypothetical protein CROQUDRAFT_651626 [Cronartium quercuum f. sp. fusiforme G11]